MWCCGIQRETKRQKLQKALAFERLGLKAPTGSQLVLERPVADGEHAHTGQFKQLIQVACPV